MILGFKIFYALLISGVVTACFCRSCRLEEEKAAPVNAEGRINIWVSPIVFPAVILMYPLIFIMINGGAYGTSRAIHFILDSFLFLSIYFIILLVLMPLFRRYFSAKLCAVLWMVPVFVYYQSTFRLNDNILPWLTISIPVDSFSIAVIIWIIGCVVILGYQVISHLTFRSMLMKNAEKVTDEQIITLWEKERKSLKLYLSVPLFYCSCIKTPLSMGIFKKTRVVFLPTRAYTEAELSLLFQHELHHIQRGDIETKIFLGFCKAFCWFNPLVWIAVKKASEDLELSCDEIVLQGSTDATRRQYAELLLKTAGQGRGYSTCLSASAAALRYRLKKVVNPVKRHYGIVLLAVVMFLGCMSSGIVAFAGSNTTLENEILDGMPTSDKGSTSDMASTSDKTSISDIESAYLCRPNKGAAQDDLPYNTTDVSEKIKAEGLSAVLQAVTVEKIFTPYSYEADGIYLEIALTDGRIITISDALASVKTYTDGEDGWPKLSNQAYYTVKSEIPWEKY